MFTFNENTIAGLIFPILFLAVFIKTNTGKQRKDSHAVKKQDLNFYMLKHRTSERKKELDAWHKGEKNG